MIGWERIQGGKANLKRWVLSFERNVETDNELRVSGGREFQSLGAMTEKALFNNNGKLDIYAWFACYEMLQIFSIDRHTCFNIYLSWE